MQPYLSNFNGKSFYDCIEMRLYYLKVQFLIGVSMDFMFFAWIVVVAGTGWACWGILKAGITAERSVTSVSTRMDFGCKVAKLVRTLSALPEQQKHFRDPSLLRYRPVDGEQVIAVQRGVQSQSHQYTGSFQSDGTLHSFPVVNSFSAWLGLRPRRSHGSWSTTAQGRLLLTTRALVFEGDYKSLRIELVQIAAIDFSERRIRVTQRTGPATNFLVPELRHQFVARLQLALL